VPGLGLWEVVGAREAAIETAPGGRTVVVWSGTDLPGVNDGDRLPGRWYKETLEPLSPQARIVARFEDGSAAAVMSSFGKGRTLMLGSCLSAAYISAPTPEAERFYAGLLAWAGVALPVTVSGAPLEVRYLESGRDTLLFVFNHAAARAQAQVSLRRAAGAYAATDLVGGQPVEVTRTDEGIRLAVGLAPSEVSVLRITRQ
jgi:hypothetical protein